MESYLKNNPGVRWSIITVLLLCIILQLFLVRNKLVSQTLITATPSLNEPLPTERLSLEPSSTPTSIPDSCKVLSTNGVNVWNQPTTNFGQIINKLPFNSQFIPSARTRDMAWLLVRVEDRFGWISFQEVSEEMAIECKDDLLNLPEIDSTSDLSQFIPTATATPVREPTAKVTLTPKGTPKSESKQTPSPTSTATITPTLIPTATPQSLRRQNNGPDIHAPRRTFNISLDGNLSEWNNVPRVEIMYLVYQPYNRQGGNDLSGFTLATWDNQYLYLAAQVTDDKIIQLNWGEQLIYGDGIELYWDSELEEDFNIDEYNNDDSQMVFSPTSRDDYPAFWVHFSPNPGSIDIGARPTEVGYNLEVRIPWSLLGVSPTENAIFGYAVTIIDNDTEGTSQQETMMSTTPRAPYTHPTYWGNFILEP